MEITQTPPAFSSTTAVTQTETASTQISTDFDTFLRMLTVQMQNQDPLNPIESSDYAVQLATFSGVEQQVKTNDLLRGLAGQMGASSLSQLAGWVGKEARTTAPAMLNGNPITIVPSIAANADTAEVVVRDNTGTEVQRFAIQPTTDPVQWAGVTTDGYPYPAGLYTFDVVSYAGEFVLETLPAQTYGKITEVRSESGGAVVVMAGGATVPSASVTALRDPALR